VIALVFSADKENDPDVVGINAAAAALALSDIPFSATVGAVRVGRVDGEFVINPTYAERAATTVNIMVVGHKDGIVMIESGAKEETEEVILAAIEFAHTEIKKIVAAIDELVAKAGKPKRAFTAPEFDEAYYAELKAKIGDKLKDALDTKTHGKTESYALIKEIKDELAAELSADDPAAKKKLAHYYEHLRERLFREQVTKDRIRPIAAPSTRFVRSPSKPAFCPAPTARLCSPAARPRRWLPLHWEPPTTASAWKVTKASSARTSCSITTSRRLAWRNRPHGRHGPARNRTRSSRRTRYYRGSAQRRGIALLDPHRLRHSRIEWFFFNGLGLRASLALYDSGIQLKGSVAGVAMGLVKEGDDYAILTDIAGAEDHYGDMDFKVAGTRKGITALQMDIKIGGLTARSCSRRWSRRARTALPS